MSLVDSVCKFYIDQANKHSLHKSYGFPNWFTPEDYAKDQINQMTMFELLSVISDTLETEE